MDTSLYDIRRDLSRALAELHEAQQSYPDDPTLHAIDNLQSAVERLTDALEEIHRYFIANGAVPNTAVPAVPPVGATTPVTHSRRGRRPA